MKGGHDIRAPLWFKIRQITQIPPKTPKKVEKNCHETIKRRLKEDYPGLYAIILPEYYNRIRSIIRTYHIPQEQETEIFEVVASLEDAVARDWLDRLQTALEAESETA